VFGTGERVSRSAPLGSRGGTLSADTGPVLLTVREVAKILRVCRATVYAMLERGELEQARVSNAIRVLLHPQAKQH
jgi:excisionase family DNA binding protein